MGIDIEASLKRMITSKLSSRGAEELYDAKKYVAARRRYLWGVWSIVANEKPMPGVAGSEDGFWCTLYLHMGSYERTELMRCCNGIAKCFVTENKREKALAWLEEVNVLARNTYRTAYPPQWEWDKYTVNLPDMTFQRITALTLMSDVFISIGNTGQAAHLRITGSEGINIPWHHYTPALNAISNPNLSKKYIQNRHPDPQTTHKLMIVDPDLQIRGSWEKLSIRANGMSNKATMSTFIWNSHLYVAGGRKDSLGPFFRDLWRLDLNKLGAWQRLPDYPRAMTSTGPFLGWNMIVDGTKAYLFTGQPNVDYFDLINEKWGSFNTVFTRTTQDIAAGVGNWPYPGSKLQDSTAQIVKGKMYVFGGTHNKTNLGSNLFMCLDLATRVWKRLTGTPTPSAPDHSCPGPRKTPSSWINAERDRMFVIFGEAERNGAVLTTLAEPFGAEVGYPYDDMWSWNIADSHWRRERLSGNLPAPRSELSCTFNQKLKQAIVWDTFIYDAYSTDSSGNPIPPKWKQVITRGFPTYRCQAHLQSDPETGKTYLFGGFTNTSFVPTCKPTITRTFGDVWQLKIDEPGECFEGVDLEEEMRTAKAGPWQRCFTCASAGPWKKCGGSCRGAAFFCGTECFKDGWKEHKERHGCSKT